MPEQGRATWCAVSFLFQAVQLLVQINCEMELALLAMHLAHRCFLLLIFTAVFHRRKLMTFVQKSNN